VDLACNPVIYLRMSQEVIYASFPFWSFKVNRVNPFYTNFPFWGFKVKRVEKPFYASFLIRVIFGTK
jgi:hypothetical protein